MGIRFTEVRIDEALIFNKSNLLQLFDAYDKSDMIEICSSLNKFRTVEFSEELQIIRKNSKLTLFNDINSITVDDIIKKYFEITNSINEVIEVRNRFTDYRQTWMEIKEILSSFYEIKKDALIISDDMKVYKNKDEKLSATNVELDEIVRALKFTDIVLLRLKHFESEIKSVMDYLMNIRQDTSRVQSAVELAMDTGEKYRYPRN